MTGATRVTGSPCRLAAAAVLQKSGDTRAIPALVEALHDPEEPVRHAAAVTLGTLSWEAAHEEDYAAALVSGVCALALATIPDRARRRRIGRALEGVIKASDDESPQLIDLPALIEALQKLDLGT